jgi:hypothetical protein
MRELPYKHFFTVHNGRYAWEDDEMFALKKRILEGKRGYAIIEEDTDESSPKQLAYYFGGIIRKECMNSECFAGLSEKEIHNYLLLSVAGSMREVHRKDGSSRLVEMPGEFEPIMRNVKKMSEYIEKVIAFLQVEHDIFPKPAEHYKNTNKFVIKKQHFK